MEEILKQPKFQEMIVTFAERQGAAHEQIEKEATEYLEELYTTHEPLAGMFAVQGAQYILSRGYDTAIDVNPEEIKALARLMRKHPVAFVMTHKTYIDMFVLAVVLARHGLPLPYTFAGINMAFLGLAQFGRQVGSIFIRRSFKDNELYKAVLRYFIAHLINEKQHFMWAIEGTRSRTGKLVWPKMGILKYIAQGAEDTGKEVKYVPVSIVYDLIPDVKEMTEQGRGKEKSAESLSWFVNYVRKMGDEFGRISLRLGEPVNSEVITSAPEVDNTEYTHLSSDLSRFAFELAYKINEVTPVTTTSLVCATLLSKFSATKRAIETDVASLMQLIETHNPNALVDRGRPIGESVQVALNLLVGAEIVALDGSGVHAKYAIVPEHYLPAVYYANMAVHHLVQRSYVELALAKAAETRASERLLAFWTEIMALRDLFKFEFFYSRKPLFSDEIEDDLVLLDPEWQKRLRGRNAKKLQLLRDQPILVANAVLTPYIESYRVVARALQQWPDGQEFNESLFIDKCLALGEELNWQGKIVRAEAVSKPFLVNGLRLAQNRGLIPTPTYRRAKELKAFLAELDGVAERMEVLQEIVLSAPKDVPTAGVPLEREIVPGSKTEAVTKEIFAAEEGPQVGAFFDLDRTLIDGFSAKEFFQARLFSGQMGAREVLGQFAGVLVYAMGNQNFAGLASVAARGVQGVEEKVFLEMSEDVYKNQLAEAIFPESRALVAAHLAKGHTVAIVSAATPYQVEPIARDLGIDHVMCTRMEVRKGKFTGRIIEPACWGEGKAVAARHFAEIHNVDLSKSYFYTDSAEDLPLLEIVGQPRPLNPDPKLSALAYENGWPVARFTGEQRPGAINIARTALLVGSMIPVTLAGLLSGARSMSWQEGINTMIATLGDVGTRIAGIELVVRGEENLWKERPAVFIFSHQSNYDMFVLTKLLREDIRGIAKKELKYSPIGPLMMAAGMVFVDRSNREKAIEALKPAVDALKNGTSIAIAPEGTRSYDYKLGKFKKGAFHIAMQAGVPVVPIVLKNTHDVLPRGTSIVRPSAVEVVILPPVPTTDWTRETLDEHIAEVRGMFLKELGQEEEDEELEIEVVEE